ncbi:PQQ-binding-like beta-propeller repeat protein [Parvibaculum sp.]|uniref:outer membrane protein assembly factor BamB family protein n=1 Tax=Parvibaculum sp. TaxID=2024848 RepID=UPI002731CB71|nr:PQQ-binding-like beta-propeller repeat protein [Parvibaculum sp.]MDP1628369.1 SMP-30/gluconolactonase/LRE family protein [Parvibaculum sp.]MDP2149912.1 SMP-30/gluconolactonase/LRE family protein [Parvibaculum sp.]MDP3329482.1 SMP-30/gluconolactonase/LRE family protein [Parvibaculum sp.]
MKRLQGAAIFAAVIALAAACSDKEEYAQETVTPPSPFHGIHGITVTKEGRILAGSVVGRAIYEVNGETGETGIYEGPPEGMADDLEQGPDGTLAWTAFLDGKVYARTLDGTLLTLADGLPGMNSLAWTDDGRLFATQVFLGDALYELDPSGKNPPRKIMEGMGGLNGFDFGPDGHLYGPLWFKKQVVRVDVDAGTLDVVAEGFKTPAAANFNSKGDLYVVDTEAGHVYRVNTSNGEKTLVSEVAPAIDNLAFDAADNLYITNMADNAVISIDTETGSSRTLVSGVLAVAGGIAFGGTADDSALYVADLFALRKIDPVTGTVTEMARVWSSNIDYPLSITVANGKIAVAALTAGAVQIFDQKTGESLGLHHGFTTPADAIALADGDVLVSEYARGAIVRVKGNDWSKRTDIATGLAGPAMIRFDSNGKLYVSEREAGTVSSIDAESGERSIVADGLSSPEGFDIASDGQLVVAEVGAKRITAVDLETGKKVILKENLPIGFDGPDSAPAIFIPTGVAVVPNGDIFYSSDIDVAIYKLKKG